MLGYLLSGLFGIACCILGLLSAPFTLMSLNIFAGFAAEAYEISGIGKFRNKAKQSVKSLIFVFFFVGYLRKMR